MKPYHFKKFKWVWLAIAFCGGMFLLVRCNRVSEQDICGVYVCSGDGVVDTIVLGTNGTFEQTITFTNGGSWTVHS